MTRSLARMNWPDLKRAVESGARTVILPLGATEQHGPHLPLATDTIRARALAERVADRLEPDVLVAPALPFGCSDEHTGFPGLLGLDAGTLARVIADLARRMSGWGVRRLVLLSAHGGNAEALDLALKKLAKELPELDVLTNGSLEAIAPALLEAAGQDGISAGVPSRLLPPWLETEIAVTPASTARSASSTRITPLSMNGPSHCSRSQRTSSHVGISENIHSPYAPKNVGASSPGAGPSRPAPPDWRARLVRSRSGPREP